MKKAITMTVALVALPLNIAFAAPADVDWSDGLRDRLEVARSQKASSLESNLAEARLFQTALAEQNAKMSPAMDQEPSSLSLYDLCLPGKVVLNVLLPIEGYEVKAKSPVALEINKNSCLDERSAFHGFSSRGSQ